MSVLKTQIFILQTAELGARASRSESAGILFVTPIRHCFDSTGRRAEDHARAACVNSTIPRDARYLHAGSDNGKSANAQEGRDRASVPRKKRKKKRKLCLAKTRLRVPICCALFCGPRGKWKTFGKFLRKNGGGRRDSKLATSAVTDGVGRTSF